MKRSKKTKPDKLTARQKELLKTYAKESYLEGMEYDLPDWMFDYREELMNKISKRDLKLYQILKDNNLDFKIKYPVKSNGKWKFADIFLPDYNLVILLMNFQETVTPVCSMYDRTEHFKDHHKVEMILPEEIDKVMNVVNKYKPKRLVRAK